MYQHRVRRVGWSVFPLVCVAIGGSVLWRLTPARQPPISPPVTETVSPLAPPIQQKSEPVKTYDLAALNADSGDNKRFGAFELDRAAAAPPDTQQQQDEILIVGDPMRIVLPHSRVDRSLVVRVKPGRPVTFTAPDSGEFPNGEATITVTADGRGLAATTFSVTNVGEYRVLATSPEYNGRAEFIVQCVTRKFRDDLASGRYAREYFAERRAAAEQRTVEKARVEERINRKELRGK